MSTTTRSQKRNKKRVWGICIFFILLCVCICFFVFCRGDNKIQEGQDTSSFTHSVSQENSMVFEKWMDTQGYAQYASLTDTAPAILNRFSVQTDNGIFPSSPWILSQKTENWVLAEDIPGEYPNVRIETGMYVSPTSEKKSFQF
jgi:predicted PurR-regulated permease PerM